MKRHIYQQFNTKHETENEILNDDDTLEIIFKLYDHGVTIKMLKASFEFIENERKIDQMSDFDVYKL